MFRWLERFLRPEHPAPEPPPRLRRPPDPDKVRAEQRASDLARRLAALELTYRAQSREGGDVEP